MPTGLPASTTGTRRTALSLMSRITSSIDVSTDTVATSRVQMSESVTVVAIETGVVALTEARTLIERFHSMIRTKVEAGLDAWLADAGTSLLASFAAGITKAKAAVRAAIVEPWSNGQTEGQINKLKMVKRQMYGRAKVDLLEARLIGAT